MSFARALIIYIIINTDCQKIGISVSIVASISACHAEDPGSIPGLRALTFYMIACLGIAVITHESLVHENMSPYQKMYILSPK